MGGLHLNVLSTARFLKRKKHQVTVLCKNGKFADLLRKENINVIETDFKITQYRSVIMEILNLHSYSPIDVIHTHPFESRKLSIVIAKILNKPLFLTLHGKYLDEVGRYIDNYSMVFTVSEGIKDYVLDILEHTDKYKFHVIPNGVNLKKFKPNKFNSLLNFNKENNRINISVISRFDKDKQYIIDIFYKGLKFTTETYEHVSWTIVGDGSELEKMKSEVNKYTKNDEMVTFTGWKNSELLVKEYLNSDIVIAPGRSALEGLACGKPVIAIGSKGYIGLINHENWLKGVYSNFGGIGNKHKEYVDGSIEKDLKSVIENHDLRKELGKLGLQIISQFYNEDDINEKLLSFYYIESKNNKYSTVSFNEFNINDILECQVKNIDVNNTSHNNYLITVDTYDNQIEYAWYIYRNNIVIEKIMYTNNNKLDYTFKRPGIYKIRVFIRRREEIYSFDLDKIIIT